MRPKPNPPQAVLPIETMASVLATSGVDLGSEAACICELRAADFDGDDIFDGLEMAIERARELRVEAA